MREVAKSVDSRVPLGFLCAFLLFEYLRVQDLIPLLGKTRIQTVFFALFVIVVFQQVSRSKEPTAPQFRLFLGFVALAFAQVPLVATNWFYALQFGYSLALILVGCAAIAYIPRNEQDLKTFLGWLIAIHVCLAVLGIRGYSGNQFNDSGYTSTGYIGGGFLGDENDAALAMLVALPLALYLFRQATTAGARLGWGMGGLLILMTVVFTFSRGGFLGLLAIALWGILTTKKRVQVIGALALAALLLFAVAPDEYWARMRTITDTEEGTAKIRQNYWAAARRMFADSPIWGVGGDNGGVLMPEYSFDFPEEYRPNQWGRAFHSLYFQLLAEFGSLGVLLIGSVVILNFRDLERVRALARDGKIPESMGHLATCLRFSWIGFFVPAAFISVLSYPHLYYLTALTIGLRRMARAHEAQARPVPAAQPARVAPSRARFPGGVGLPAPRQQSPKP